MAISSTGSSTSSSVNRSTRPDPASSTTETLRTGQASPAGDAAAPAAAEATTPVETRPAVDAARQADARRVAAQAGVGVESRLRGQLDARLSQPAADDVPGSRAMVNGTAPGSRAAGVVEAAAEGPAAQDGVAAAPQGDTAEAAVATAGSNNILGDMTTTGAGAETAGQDNLDVTGVAASEAMAETDLEALREHEQTFIDVGLDRDLPPAVLAAIASRESRGGAALDEDGLGDNGHGFGLMQVDDRSHVAVGEPTSREHIEQAADILNAHLEEVRTAHPDWTEAEQMRGAIAAYNVGADDVQTVAGMDVGTTGDDYSADVVARAQYLARQGFGGEPE